MKRDFNNAKVIIETRKGGVQPAIFIIENNNVHMVTITPDGNFDISNEGVVGERYDDNGCWCGSPTVRDYLKRNKWEGIKYNIDGDIYDSEDAIPESFKRYRS